MRIDDINRVEQELNIKVPDELIAEYLAERTTGIEEFDNIKYYFINDADQLIKLHKRLYARGLQNKRFNKHHFVIGRAFKSSYYLIDLRDIPLNVYWVERNKSWAYRPDDLVPNMSEMGLANHIEHTLMYLHMNIDSKLREETGIQSPPATAEKTYAFLRGLHEKIEQTWAEAKKKRELDANSPDPISPFEAMAIRDAKRIKISERNKRDADREGKLDI